MRKDTIQLNKFLKMMVIIVIATFSLQLFGMPSDVSAQWRDNSDQLPGINEGPSPIVYVAIGLAVVALVYVIVKATQNKKVHVDKGGDDPLEEKKPETGTPDSSRLKNLSYGNVEISDSDESDVDDKKQSMIEPFIGLQTEPERGLIQHDSKEKTVVMGLTVNF